MAVLATGGIEDGCAILVSTEYAVGNQYMIVYVAVEITAEAVGDHRFVTDYNNVL